MKVSRIGLWLSLALCSASAFAAPSTLDRLEASVNSSLILHSDVDQFRRTLKLRQQLDPLFAGTVIASSGVNASARDIVDFLINEKLILQLFPTADAEVETEISSIQSNNHIDRSTLKTALGEQGYAFEDYFELIRASTSKRNLIDRDIRTKVTISDDDVKNYFYNHYSKSASAPSAFHLQIITISPKNYKNPAAAKEVATRATKALADGEVFEEVAKRFSDGPTASSGGDLGTVSEETMAPEVRAQAKKLRIGQISEAFGSPKTGYSILKLVDIQSGDSSKLDKVKDEIRNQLAASEYQHQISLWIERQRQSAFIHRTGEASTIGLPSGT